MHDIEPYFNWRHLYTAEEDEHSPFFRKEYSEIYFSNAVYDHLIHPQWDEFGSETLYLKLLFVNYEQGYAIIEFIGEWNDCISFDVQLLKREIIDLLLEEGIDKFILLGENVLNFHYNGDDYYEEWFQDIEDGWIAAINFQPHVLQELRESNLDYYFNFGGELDEMPWRTFSPSVFFHKVEAILNRRLATRNPS
ncbi:MAG: hypothetical protein WD077_15670 [Bacteroidia bacterium]